MVKKILITLFAVIAVAGCKDEKLQAVPDTPKKPAIQQAPQDYGAHNAMNSLDYAGTYVLDGDNSKTIILSYGGEYEAQIDGRFSGKYEWDVTGSVIYLKTGDQELGFFIGENFIKQIKPDTGLIFRKRAD